MRKCLFFILAIITVLPAIAHGELQASLFIDFEDGKGNLLTQNAAVEKSQEDGNSSLVLKANGVTPNGAAPNGEKAYMQKSFRNMAGSVIAGFKIQICGNSNGNIYFVSDEGSMIKALTFENGAIYANAAKLYEYEDKSELKAVAYINTKKQNITFEINGIKSKTIGYSKLASGISGFAAECCGEGEVRLDNIYCYVGDVLLDEYSMMSLNQKALVRTRGEAVYSVYGGTILNGKTAPDAAGARIIDSEVYLPLRNTVESVGGTVDWSENATVVKINGESITLDAQLKEKVRMIDSVTYLPKNTYTEVFGIYLHEDLGGVCMLSCSNNFVKSNKESALYQELVKNLTGNDFYLKSSDAYSITPSDFENFYMENIPVSSVWASSESQPELGYVKENVADGDLVSRWSSDENGAELVLDLGQSQKIDAAALAFMNGTVRRAYFEIYTSNDNKNWELQIERSETSGKTDLREVYPINATARYVKYKGYGTSSSVWNSVTEFNALRIKREYVY